MRWSALEAFEVVHEYPPGQSPGENHPSAYGRLEHARFMSDGQWSIAVRSTGRRHDGWSYNVVTCREHPWWFSYFHHERFGRVRHSGTCPPSRVEQQWNMDRHWASAAPM